MMQELSMLGSYSKKTNIPTSLILTVLNEQNTILPLLESITNQTQRPNEVIITDAGSTDDTVKIIKQFSHRHPRLNIKILKTPQANRSQGRNIAIKTAQNSLIAVTDAGCTLDPHWLEQITQPFKNPQIDIVAGAYQPITKTIWQHIPALNASIDITKVNPTTYLPSSRSVAFRKTAWKKVDGYPEHLNTAEDLVFSQRLLQAGLKQTIKSQAIVYWHPPQTFPKIIRQFYNYSYGDGFAGIESPQTQKHLSKTILLLLLILTILLSITTPTQAFYIFLILIFLQTANTIKPLKHTPYIYNLTLNYLWKLILIPTTLIGFWSGLIHRIIKPMNQTTEQQIIQQFNQSPLSYTQVLKTINTLSTATAQKLHQQNHQSNIFTITFYPLLTFINHYIIKLQIFQGNQGFILSALLSFNSFLTQGKLYLLNPKNHPK